METRNPFFDSKLFVVLMGCLTALDPLSIDMYLPAFTDISRAFSTSISNVELSVSTFFVGMALGQLIYGPLADRLGRRTPLLGGMALYLLATLGCALAPNIETFILCRVLQALGGCSGMVITRAIVRDIFENKRVAEFFSGLALVMGLAPILAPSIGSVVNDAVGWRGIFYVLAGANILCMTSIYFFLPESLPAQMRKKVSVGAVLRSYGGLLRHRNFVGYLIPDAAIRAGMFAYIAGSPFVFINLLGIPQNRYGLIFGLNGLGLMAAAQVNRFLLRKFSPDMILRWSVRLAAFASAAVFISGWVAAPAPIFLLAIFVFLATLNFVGPNSLAGALSDQRHQAGTASALYGSLQWSLATFSSFLVGILHNGTALPMTSVIFLCGVVSLTGFQVLVRARTTEGPMNSGARAVPAAATVPNDAEPGS